MPFMQREITGRITWIEIDGTHGTTWIPGDMFNLEAVKKELEKDEPDLSIFQDYYEGEIWEAYVIEGFGCRLSAPGYMDCTKWTVFQTEAACVEYLDEYYPEDED